MDSSVYLNKLDANLIEMKRLGIIIILLFGLQSDCFSQEYSWFFIRARDTLFQPEFRKDTNQLKYTGNDSDLASILDQYTIYEFKKTMKNARKENLKKTFFVVANKDELLKDLLNLDSKVFEFGELIKEEDKKIFEPNDYGMTSTIGDKKGLLVDLSYLDYLELPKAWYYTTGSPNTIIGVSDAYVDTTDIDFKEKTKIIRKTREVKGHGSSVASIAAAQGDNGHGVPGVCYDCNIYNTSLGGARNLTQLLELSRMGVKVINCSWSSPTYYDYAQEVINEIKENGTIIVASAGNRDWKTTKGEKLLYPASYENVISVSAGHYKHESLNDNIRIAKKGYPYAESIKGYVGRTIGFKDNDINKEHYIFSVSITTLNSEVDILSPSTGVFSYGKYLLNNTINYDGNEHTSNATPLVTGTVGLMMSLQPCLTLNEVEAILKITAFNIDHIKANKPYTGKYGAGLLQSGNAVEMVYKLMTEEETSYIENQDFYRWLFPINSFSKETVIRNQKFREDAIFELTAKNKIVIGANTVLRPNAKGRISLKINPDLEKECDLELREGFPNNKYYYPKN